jgi:hypothetical protein
MDKHSETCVTVAPGITCLTVLRRLNPTPTAHATANKPSRRHRASRTTTCQRSQPLKSSPNFSSANPLAIRYSQFCNSSNFSQAKDVVRPTARAARTGVKSVCPCSKYTASSRQSLPMLDPGLKLENFVINAVSRNWKCVIVISSSFNRRCPLAISVSSKF